MNEDNQVKITKRKFGCLSSLIIVIIGVVAIVVVASILNDSTSSNSPSVRSYFQEEIRTKEKSLTESIQVALDKSFEGTDFGYKAEVKIGSIESYGIIGWLNVYPLNSQSWDSLSLSQKKDFVATLISISRADVSNNLGQVYIRNEVRVLAEGVWDAFKGNVIKIK